MNKQEPCSDENNDNNQQNDSVDGSAGDLDFSFHGTSLGIKKVHAKNSHALQKTGALPPLATLHFKRLFYAPSGFVKD